MNPITHPLVYDVVTLAQMELPGVASIEGAGLGWSWDTMKAMGVSYAIQRFTGINPGEFSIKCKMWEAEHFDQWEKVRRKLIVTTKNTLPIAYDIFHPFLQELGITVVVIAYIGIPSQVEDGIWEIEIKVKQQHRVKPEVGSAQGGTQTTDAPDAQDVQLQGLGSQTEGLAAEFAKR